MDGESFPLYRIKHHNTVLEPSSLPGGALEYRFGAGEEEGTVTLYPVLPGIQLAYNDFRMPRCSCRLESSSRLLEVRYCHQGREEGRWVCGDYLYLGPGDLVIARMEEKRPALSFPTGRYQGISVVLDLDTLAHTSLPVLGNHPLLLAEKFCPGHHFFAMRANSHIAHIFTELYHFPDAIRREYFQIKILELLIFLHLVDPSAERQLDQVTRGQIEVIKEVRNRLEQDLAANPTIDQLAKEFCISPTSLKTNFKAVYHQSVKEYLRKLRMERAALLLRSGNLSVAQVAAQVGYSSQSKFASVFKEQYGLSPMEYRKKCAHTGL